MERRIGSQGWTIVDNHAIAYGLSDDPDIQAAHQTSVVVKEINVRPSQTLRDKDSGLVAAEDKIYDIRIGYRDLGKGTLAVNCR